MALELAGNGVRVNAICPGQIAAGLEKWRFGREAQFYCSTIEEREKEQEMTPSEALVETLVAGGVKNVFGIVGPAYMDVLDLFPETRKSGRAPCLGPFFYCIIPTNPFGKRKSMKNRIVWLLLMALAISMVSTSCTHKPYHPTKSDREWTSDHEACEKWVREGIRDEPDTYDNFDEMRLIRQCMQDKGWQWERTGLFDFKKEPAE